MSATDNVAPAPANARQQARPMPPAAPTTSTRRPDKDGVRVMCLLPLVRPIASRGAAEAAIAGLRWRPFRVSTPAPVRWCDHHGSSMTIREALRERGLEIPPGQVIPAEVQLTYRRLTRSGDIVYVAGHGPTLGAGWGYLGKIGRELTVEDGIA